MIVLFMITVENYPANGIKPGPTVLRSSSRTLRSAVFLNEMEDLKCSRKLDTSGRIVIPVRLRDQLGLTIGDEYGFYLHEIDGNNYLCIKCPNEKKASEE